MGISLLSSMLLATILYLILHSLWRPAALGVDEESAHALALERRRKLTLEPAQKQRRAMNRRATASVLGSGEDGIDCRILKVSPARMRISVRLPMPLGEQINVNWENQFFVGVVCNSAAQGRRHVVRLQLIASNQDRP
jgi:hypothetical protein